MKSRGAYIIYRSSHLAGEQWFFAPPKMMAVIFGNLMAGGTAFRQRVINPLLNTN
ncbi:hypothetical protein [Mesobacillus foraminis]|uniref:hypothetical protein n=1 Tax=Mesobacillus foraminis TaxID=279826 RepID=UPI0018EE771B|nr:hypothetical protein [Mesobacillus foraminis]